MENRTGIISNTTHDGMTREEKQQKRLNDILEASKIATDFAEISQITGLSYGQVRWILRKYPEKNDQAKANMRRNIEESKFQLMVKASLEAATYKEMAANINLSYNQIAYILKKNPLLKSTVSGNLWRTRISRVRKAMEGLEKTSSSVERLGRINKLSVRQVKEIFLMIGDPVEMCASNEIQNLQELIMRILSASKYAYSKAQLAELAGITLCQLEIILELCDCGKTIEGNISKNNDNKKLYKIMEASQYVDSMQELTVSVIMKEDDVRQLLSRYPQTRKMVNRNIRRNMEKKKLDVILKASEIPTVKTLEQLSGYVDISYSKILRILDNYPKQKQMVRMNLQANRNRLVAINKEKTKHEA